MRGPLVYCADEADNPSGVLSPEIPEKAYFKYSFDKGLFNVLGKITGTATMAGQKKEMTAIPYFAWVHRKMGEMAVLLESK